MRGEVCATNCVPLNRNAPIKIAKYLFRVFGSGEYDARLLGYKYSRQSENRWNWISVILINKNGRNEMDKYYSAKKNLSKAFSKKNVHV